MDDASSTKLQAPSQPARGLISLFTRCTPQVPGLSRWHGSRGRGPDVLQDLRVRGSRRSARWGRRCPVDVPCTSCHCRRCQSARSLPRAQLPHKNTLVFSAGRARTPKGPAAGRRPDVKSARPAPCSQAAASRGAPFAPMAGTRMSLHRPRARSAGECCLCGWGACTHAHSGRACTSGHVPVTPAVAAAPAATPPLTGPSALHRDPDTQPRELQQGRAQL